MRLLWGLPRVFLSLSLSLSRVCSVLKVKKEKQNTGEKLFLDMRARSLRFLERCKKKKRSRLLLDDGRRERTMCFSHAKTNERVRMLRVDRFDRSIVVFRDSRLSKTTKKKKEKKFSFFGGARQSTKHRSAPFERGT
jgi:hypothetical protein